VLHSFFVKEANAYCVNPQYHNADLHTNFATVKVE